MTKWLCLMLATMLVVVTSSVFPSIPTQYRAVISANFIETGYTLAYTEWYDGTTGKLRTQGRLAPTDIVEISDINAKMLWRYDPASPVETCKVYNLTAARFYSPLLGPSTDFFTTYVNESRLTYFGKTNEVRAVPTNWWNSDYTGNYTDYRSGVTWNFVRNISYYFVDTTQVSGVDELPLRVHVQQTILDYNTGNTSYADHYYDWIDILSETPDAQLFIPPATCTPADARDRLQLPTTSTVAAPPVGSPSPPSVPSQFRMVMEAKQYEAPSPGYNASESIFSGTWYLDRIANRERFEYLNDDYIDETQLVIYDTSAPSGGTQYIINQGFCTASLLSVDETDEAFSVRAGSIPKLFKNPLYIFGATYAGQKVARGITADVWKKQASETTGDTAYEFVMEIYFYPDGWQFPGRNITAGTRLPMRIVNTGTYRTISDPTQYAYTDTWDIFLLVPSVPDVSLFDLDAYNCPVLPITPGDDTFPVINTQYSVTVSANFDQTGYTFAYNEWYDGARGLLRTDGLVDGSNVTTLFDFNARRMYTYNSMLQPYEATSGCNYRTIDATTIKRSIMRPSVEWFSYLANVTTIPDAPVFSYLGTTYAARNLLCDYWRTKISFTYLNFTMQYTAVFYFAVGYIPGQQRLPIRVELAGARHSLYLPPGSVDPLANIFHHVYDFVNWQRGTVGIPPYASDPLQLPIPMSSCTPLSSSWQSVLVNRIPTVNQVVDVGSATRAFPPLPITFEALIETKLSDDNSENTYAMTWWLDIPNSRERVDYQELGGGTLTRWSYALLYDQELVYDKGTQYLLKNGICSSSAISTPFANPLSSVRSGFMVDLFRGTAGVDPTYIGRQAARSVMADVWRSPITRTSNGVTYTFNVDIYFFPEGWQFPGREGVDTTTRIPMRFITNGTKDGVAFSDTWDLFRFIPHQPDPALFNTTLLSCTTTPTPTPVTSSTGSGGDTIINNKPGGAIIAAGVLGAVGGIAFLIGVICCVRRYKRVNSPTDEPIELGPSGPSDTSTIT